MDDLREEVLFQREAIKMMWNWMRFYRLGFYIASAGWIITVVGFIFQAA